MLTRFFYRRHNITVLFLKKEGYAMRRVTSACLLQTMRFDTANDTDPEQDLEMFCRTLNRKNTKYFIEDKKKEPDGSLVIKIRKQYNSYRSEGYLD